MILPVKILEPEGLLPTRAHETDAGLDLYAPVDHKIGRGKLLRFGLKIALKIPDGHVGLIKDRSSLATQGIHVLGGVLDSGYVGEVAVVLKNLGAADHEVLRRDRVAQLLIVPVARLTPEEVDELPSTDRGVSGFGGSGR